MSRLIGLDHGSRRIGLAVGDTETGLAFARPALRRANLEADVAAVIEVAAREGAERVIVGLPLNMDGSEGPQAIAARTFGTRLAAAGLAVEFQDERLTSWEAGERLAAEGRRPPRRSGELDSAAARLILQEYLDALGRPGPGVDRGPSPAQERE
ncbi:MAG TPA: Holliday junction resolvase RuvX [candidate division Zixibacteria bacterium]|nr:Holliday junction resolvase RuvX [candidate division Zixibacteria bacterium]